MCEDQTKDKDKNSRSKQAAHQNVILCNKRAQPQTCRHLLKKKKADFRRRCDKVSDAKKREKCMRTYSLSRLYVSRPICQDVFEDGLQGLEHLLALDS